MNGIVRALIEGFKSLGEGFADLGEGMANLAGVYTPKRQPAWSPPPKRDKPRRFTLALLRQAAGMLPDEIAAKTGLSLPAVFEIERHPAIHLELLPRYLKGLGAEVEVAAVLSNGRTFMLDLGPRTPGSDGSSGPNDADPDQ